MKNRKLMKAKAEQRFIKRSRIEIMECLLRSSYNGSRKTRLIYGCNLSLSQFNKYAEYLIEGGLLTKNTNENHIEIFQITKKGIEFLTDIERIKTTLNKM